LGTKTNKKYIVLTCLFLATSILVYSSDRTRIVKNKPPLQNSLRQLNGYELLREIELSDDHIKMLKLDDYVFYDYKDQNSQPNLYIGFYYTANKAYASHSPLICYPSQGWKIDNKPIKQSMKVGEHTINYEEITTSFDERRELVLYWYQAGLQTNTQIYKNKIDMGYNKLIHNDEQHGFVRVSVVMESSYEDSKTNIIRFIKAFYPSFADYISD
jgi:EpsI family protein